MMVQLKNYFSLYVLNSLLKTEKWYVRILDNNVCCTITHSGSLVFPATVFIYTNE